MPMITYQGQEFECGSDETILAALARQGVMIRSGCQSGGCQTCMTKALKGKPSKISQHALQDTLRAQNYFLPCVCKPTEDIEMGEAPEPETFTAEITEKLWLNDSVVCLRLICPEGFDYFPGQFINISRNFGKIIRSYSLASVRHEAFIELHIKRMPEGKMSGWICDDLYEGDEISFSGPMGDCFYAVKNLDAPLILAGTGTGLAPLYGIVRDAIAAGHRGEIHLLHGSYLDKGLYYTQALQKLASEVDSFTYTPCVAGGDVPENGLKGEINEILAEKLAGKSDWHVFLCGNAGIVKKMKCGCFLANIPIKNIYADEFLDASKV
ncbi:MAG: FAD-binding oxidoreductase [Mariprofundaceae bacterium]